MAQLFFSLVGNFNFNKIKLKSQQILILIK